MVYEYKTIKFDKHLNELEHVLNSQGEIGFKLVSIIESSVQKDYFVYDNYQHLTLVFCKEIPVEK